MMICNLRNIMNVHDMIIHIVITKQIYYDILIYYLIRTLQIINSEVEVVREYVELYKRMSH